jgi:hypothetical protein
MDLAAADGQMWEPEELGEILRHQLSAPLKFDLLGVDQPLVRRLYSEWTPDPPVETFRDLLSHPSPPVEILDLTKQFAKASRTHSEGTLPEEVATVLHLLSVSAALIRCGRRITRLSDDGLRYSLDWAIAQPWVDKASRSLLERGRRALGAER